MKTLSICSRCSANLKVDFAEVNIPTRGGPLPRTDRRQRLQQPRPKVRKGARGIARQRHTWGTDCRQPQYQQKHDHGSARRNGQDMLQLDM